jgi:hypothetical protein
MQPQVSKVLGPNGQPFTTQVPTQVKVGRELIPQTASEIDLMKKNTYQGLKGKYGREGSAVIESDKAQGRALKEILDKNVPGVAAINARQRKVITARNALKDAAMREENKYPIGLMDLVGLSGAFEILHALKSPGAAAMMSVPIALKHPTTAIPIARAIDAGSRLAGRASRYARPISRVALAGNAAQHSNDQLALARAILARLGR